MVVKAFPSLTTPALTAAAALSAAPPATIAPGTSPVSSAALRLTRPDSCADS